MKTTKTLGSLSVVLLVIAMAGPAVAQYPVTVESCGQPVTFAEAPRRAVSHDLNISEMMFALQLQDRMVGVSGITGWYKMTPNFQAALGKIPELAPKNPTMENLLGANPDFFFAGWYYGMKPGEAVTPASLAEHGVKTYVLTESCAHLLTSTAPRPAVTMDTMYVDMLALGLIFAKENEAKRLVDGWKARIAGVTAKVANRVKPRVFLFDSGEEKPFTAGRYAMPTAMIDAAGGTNVMDGVPKSWTTVGWESVVQADPEVIIIVGYKDSPAEERWRFLKGFPPMKDTAAVRGDRYIVLDYTEITPGPSNIEAVEKLARTLHPDLFK